MNEKNTFNELNQNAFAIFTKLFTGDDSKIKELSTRSFEIAQKWDDLEEERFKVFYSDEDNRCDWIKSEYAYRPINKHDNENIFIGEAEYGNKYWVLPILANFRTPIFATLLEIDEGDLVFTTDEFPRFKATEILLNNN